MPEICPEERILLDCARKYLGARSAAQLLASLGPKIDSERLWNLARRHGLFPLLYSSLNGNSSRSPFHPLLGALRGRYRQTVLRNFSWTAELLRILGFLERGGIRALPFKGPVLAAAVYGDLSLREFVDLDLLVRPREFGKALALLKSEGYRPQLPHPEDGAASRLVADYEVELQADAGPVAVDLHRALVPDPFFLPFDYEGLWEQAQPLRLGGAEVWTLCPEDLLSVLCVHETKDCWQKLESVLAIALLVRRPEFDWGKVIRKAPLRGGERIHWVGLGLARELLGVSAPEHVLRRMRSDRFAAGLARKIAADFFRPRQTEGVIPKLLLFYRMRRGFPEKARFMGHLALVWVRPTEKEWRWLPLPDWLFPLYYLLRPLRLAAKYVSKLWRGMRREQIGSAEAGI